MHRKDGTCYLCQKLLGGDWIHPRVEEHHVCFGDFGANRRLSEHYGLKVYLCDAHHEHSSEAVHVNRENALLLMRDAQRAFEREHPDLSFRVIFGKNYILEEDKEPERTGDTSGFIFLGENIL